MEKEIKKTIFSKDIVADIINDDKFNITDTKNHFTIFGGRSKGYIQLSCDTGIQFEKAKTLTNTYKKILERNYSVDINEYGTLLIERDMTYEYVDIDEIMHHINTILDLTHKIQEEKTPQFEDTPKNIEDIEYTRFFQYIAKKAKEDKVFKVILNIDLEIDLDEDVSETLEEKIAHNEVIPARDFTDTFINNIDTAIYRCIDKNSPIQWTWQYMHFLTNEADGEIEFDDFMKAELGYKMIHEYLGLKYEPSTGFKESILNIYKTQKLKD